MQFTNLYTYENLLPDCTLGHVCLAGLKMLLGLLLRTDNKYATWTRRLVRVHVGGCPCRSVE